MDASEEQSKQPQSTKRARNLAVDESDDNSAKRTKSELPVGENEAPAASITAAMTTAPSAAVEPVADDNERSDIPLQKEDTEGESQMSSGAPSSERQRWRVHQAVEDYVGLVGNMMYPSTKFMPYGYNTGRREYPIEDLSLLGYVQSTARRPSVIERWSPYEVAVFEGSIFHYGKDFYEISKMIKTKTTKEVIDFYYIWKKTEHYKKWKSQFMKDTELIELEPQVMGRKPL